ncbi:hypothetical protein NHQ30_001892 [Ciborinia camelliae]|nr:hypothetical protein NHQ30_001892 [Ciborinia camelliae]
MSSHPLSPSTTSTADFENMYSTIGSTYETAFAHDPGLVSFLTNTLPLLPPHARILDVGSGTGRPVASTLAGAGHQVFGIDISSTMVALAQKAVPNGTFVVGDMRTFEPREHWADAQEGFDAVFNILSLFILSREDIEAVAGKWKTWVKKGGLLCICMIAAEDLRPKKEGGEGWDEDGMCAREIEGMFMGNRISFTLFGREGWKWLLERNGFEVVSENTEVYTPPVEAEIFPRMCCLNMTMLPVQRETEQLLDFNLDFDKCWSWRFHENSIFPPSAIICEERCPARKQEGKVFIVTGGNQGVGLKPIKTLYPIGAIIYTVSRSSKRALEEAME